MATSSFTWRVDQGDVVSCVEASHQCSSHALRTLVQLQTGGGARHCTLKRAGKKKKQKKSTLIILMIRVTFTFLAKSKSTKHKAIP